MGRLCCGEIGLRLQAFACQVWCVLQAIDTLALNLQNKWIFPHCLAFAKEAAGSSDCNIRAAGCTVLVVCAEGCCDACTSHLPEVLQVKPTPKTSTVLVSNTPLIQ